MKKLLIAITTVMIVLGCGTADAATRRHKKHRAHKITYYNSNSRAVQTDATRPNAYHGDKVPENDGVKKNKQRNLNYNNGQPMPSSSGK